MSGYTHGTAVVTSTAAVLITSPSHNDGVQVVNSGPVDVYLGGSTVTADLSATGGYPIGPGDRVRVPTVGNQNDDLYAVTDDGEAVVSWLTI